MARSSDYTAATVKPNQAHQNQVSKSPPHITVVYHSPFWWTEVLLFSWLYLICMLIICTHPNVKMVSKVNKCASGSLVPPRSWRCQTIRSLRHLHFPIFQSTIITPISLCGRTCLAVLSRSLPLEMFILSFIACKHTDRVQNISRHQHFGRTRFLHLQAWECRNGIRT